MKDFLKYTLASFVGILLFTVVVVGLTLMSVVGMIASSGSTSSVKDKSVLVLDLSGLMQEQATDDISFLLGKSSAPGLQETLSAIKKAKDNDKIKGIYMECGDFYSDVAQMQEIRNQLMDFKKSKKWIVAYGENYSTSAYYLASVADKIYLNPDGVVDWHGMAFSMRFVRDLYAKVGIKYVPIKCGKYKSATEIYTEDKMSDPSREQTTRMLNVLWGTICHDVSRSRGISVAKLNQYADSLYTFQSSKTLKKVKFVDALIYNDEVKDQVKDLLKIDKDEPINQVTVADMQHAPEKTDGGKIATYYLYGEISSNITPAMLLQSQHLIMADDVCKDLAKLADDDDVKAVVLRVNSPGGSAYDSEQIWHAIELLKKKKPVVVSMGGAAASGGYYISSGANYIFAEPTTITGSIGIFGILKDQSNLYTQKLGMKYDVVKSNRNADIGGTGLLPFTPEQLSLLQASVNRGYIKFKNRVSKGRHMTMAQVENVAQGHVFMGCDALKLKLVDELGGMNQAVAKAAKLAKLDTYYTAVYPEPKSVFEQVFDQTQQNGNRLDEQMHLVLGDYYEPLMQLRQLETMAPIQARLPYFWNIN